MTKDEQVLGFRLMKEEQARKLMLKDFRNSVKRYADMKGVVRIGQITIEFLTIDVTPKREAYDRIYIGTNGSRDIYIGLDTKDIESIAFVPTPTYTVKPMRLEVRLHRNQWIILTVQY